jgi:hypothetical protein
LHLRRGRGGVDVVLRGDRERWVYEGDSPAKWIEESKAATARDYYCTPDGRRVWFEFNGTSLRLIFGDEEDGPDICVLVNPDCIHVVIHPDAYSDPTLYMERSDVDGSVRIVTATGVPITVDRDGWEIKSRSEP